MLNLIFSFSLFSVLGWLLEVGYRSIVAKKFVNPGLLKGPYLILYGSGGVLLGGFAHLLIGTNIFLKALIYALITTSLEFVSGIIALKLFNKKLWDYSDNKFNYKGIICLKFSIYWTLLALIFDYFIYPRYTSLISHIPASTKSIFGFGVLFCMLFDFSKLVQEHFFKYPKEEEEKLKKEFFHLIKPYISHPAILKLKDSYHHKKKTRFVHVVEVAYYSFLIAKKMSLDVEVTVKGAMLHDLFYYDWLREGPRLHGFRHPKISLENAKKFFSLSKKEEDIIKKHMWPLTPTPPFYLESLVVSLIDTFCSLRDYLPGEKKNIVIDRDLE
ncbi:MAG: HD domain-containing protein [Desulfonauticus sp.]|nr:HD domain-containing protein [Desulfonauticus sp.]